MNEITKQKLTRNWLYWFDPRGKSWSGIGFILNRLAGLGLTLYLFMHFMMLGKLISGEEAYNEFIHFAHNPIIVAGEFIVVLGVLLHGMNGLRIAFTSIGIGSRVQKGLLVAVLVAAAAGSSFFALKMFGGI
jgi:succinate dehydrogenase / fumarate reductase, cytochrome b subunit